MLELCGFNQFQSVKLVILLALGADCFSYAMRSICLKVS